MLVPSRWGHERSKASVEEFGRHNTGTGLARMHAYLAR